MVYPEMEMGERIANSLVSKSLLDYIELTPEVSIREILVERGFGEKSLSELGLRGRFHVTIVLIKRNDEISITPGGDACIKAGDVLFV
ncbi:MAG TPA: potassium uptake system protein, partial [Firmicutes bacterium]|nr:potassium uptake system protein [Bacillota bacterium]